MGPGKTLVTAAAVMVGAAASAGTISAVGSVTAVSDISEMSTIGGTAIFDGLTEGDPVPAKLPGITFRTGLLSGILPGVTTGGKARLPLVRAPDSYLFPKPVAGGGTANKQFVVYGGAMTFSGTVTQFGLTASRNGTQYLTAWDSAGSMLGQVSWVPSGQSAFVGIDTGATPIGLVTFGNDDLWKGATYSVGGALTAADTYVWNDAVPEIPLPGSLSLLCGGLAAAAMLRGRRRR